MTMDGHRSAHGLFKSYCVATLSTCRRHPWISQFNSFKAGAIGLLACVYSRYHARNSSGTQSVEVFGSKCYHLQLGSSDADIVVVLAAGQNIKEWLNQLHDRSKASQSFTCFRKYQRFDCEFLGVAVDIKVIKHNRKSDGACRSSDCRLRFMIEQRLEQGDFRAILIFKLLCHHLDVVQHHWQARAGKFKAVTLWYWAIAALDGVAVEGKSVGDFIAALCDMFLNFEWRRLKVVVSAAGQIEICDKGNLVGAVCIMLDNGMVNSTQNVTVDHLEKSRDAIRRAFPNLDSTINEALAGQNIKERERQLKAKVRPRSPPPATTVDESAARPKPPAPSLRTRPKASLMPPRPAKAKAPPSLLPRPPPPLAPGNYDFNGDTGIIVPPPPGTDHSAAPIVLVPPSGGFACVKERLQVPLNCSMPTCIGAGAAGSCGCQQISCSSSACFAIGHRVAPSLVGACRGVPSGSLSSCGSMLDGAVMFGGYPQTMPV